MVNNEKNIDIKKINKWIKKLLPILVLIIWLNICYSYEWGNKGLWGAIILYVGYGIYFLVRRWRAYLRALDTIGMEIDMIKLKNKIRRR